MIVHLYITLQNTRMETRVSYDTNVSSYVIYKLARVIIANTPTYMQDNKQILPKRFNEF